MYVDVKGNSKDCALLNIYNVPQSIGFEGKEIRDFTVKSSKSSFKIDGISLKDYSFDVSLHKINKEELMMANVQVKITG